MQRHGNFEQVFGGKVTSYSYRFLPLQISRESVMLVDLDDSESLLADRVLSSQSVAAASLGSLKQQNVHSFLLIILLSLILLRSAVSFCVQRFELSF